MKRDFSGGGTLTETIGDGRDIPIFGSSTLSFFVLLLSNSLLKFQEFNIAS